MSAKKPKANVQKTQFQDDYLISTGILLSNLSISLGSENGKIFSIPLEDGVELKGEIEK